MSAVAIAPSPYIEARPDGRGLGGLVALGRAAEQAFPLQRVRVRARIAGSCCRSEIEQVFANPFDEPLKAVHVFPLPPDGAVTDMVLVAGTTEVRAECREREEAERTYAAAVDRGHRAGLLTAERADVHTLRVANLPPRTQVTVRLVVVESLSPEDGRLRWRFPTVVAPRYLPGVPAGHRGPGVLPDTDLVPDASRLQPPLRLEGGTRLDLEVVLDGPVTALESSLHAVRLDLGAVVRVAPAHDSTLDRDFVLAFSTGAADLPALRAWTDGRHTLALVEPPTVATLPAVPRDAVFVVDISGSMGGAKIWAARLALKTALHGLVPGDRFKLVAFDDRVELFDDEFRDYDDASLAAADSWISALRPRGGTEMLAPIKVALAGTTPEGRLRTVLFITDGQAWNTGELVAAVSHRRGGARFFTMGIDTAVNAALMQELARAGGGTCEPLTPADDIEAAVARLEARFGSPLVLDLVAREGQPADTEPLTLFAGRPAAVLLEGATDRVRLAGRSPDGPVSYEARPTRVDWPLGALWARQRIGWLERRLATHPHEAEGLRPEILRIGLAHHVASRFTAFVAVDESVTVTGERRTVVQPVELPQGWDERFRDGGGPAREAPKRAAQTVASPMMVADSMMDRFAVPECAAAPPPPERVAMSALRGSPAPAPAGMGAVFAAQGGAAPPASEDPVARLVRAQGADGSFGGDVARTVAALLVLVLDGHTRRRGLRRRVVAKAAEWLARQESPLAADALAILDQAEREGVPLPDAGWRRFTAGGPEGRLLADRLP